MQLLLNVGGPDRVSRVQMAEAVAQIRGHNPSLIKPVSASSVSKPFRRCEEYYYPCALNLVLYIFQFLIYGPLIHPSFKAI